MSKFSSLHSYGIKATEFLSVIIQILNKNAENETSTDENQYCWYLKKYKILSYKVKWSDYISSELWVVLKIYYWDVPKQRIKTSVAADKNNSYEFSGVDFLFHQLNTTKEKTTKHTSISRNSQIFIFEKEPWMKWN